MSRAPGPRGISLYVHVPFCRAKCGYCTFRSYPVADPEIRRQVVRRTVEQARAWADQLGGLCSRTVYIGGGTPSVLAPEDLAELLSGVGEVAGSEVEEMTVEANPESLTPAFLELCAARGVGRLSLGIQSFSAALRGAVGRRCTDAEIDRSLDLVASSWPGRLSLDLISGLPGQRPGEARAEVERAIAYRPDHVSLYALTLEEGSRLREAAGADELWLEGSRRLEELGYPGYEVSNFAPAGSECLHNIGYWRLEPYLGVGPASVSTLPDGRGGVLRLENTPSLEGYLASPEPLGDPSMEEVSPRDFLFETLIMGLRLREGIGDPAFERRFGSPFRQVLPRTADRWREGGLLADLPGRLALSTAGRLFLDSLLLEAREEIDTVDQSSLRLLWP